MNCLTVELVPLQISNQKLYTFCLIIEIPIERYNEEHHGAGNEVVARKRNFSIILSFAITVHKSQGCTFDKLIVCPSREFAWGQLYVAVSRCKSLKGLYILKNRIFKYRRSYYGKWFYDIKCSFIFRMSKKKIASVIGIEIRASYTVATW